MSFYAKVIGSRANVRATVKANALLPEDLKEAIMKTIDAGKGTDDYFGQTGISLETHGHYDASQATSGITKLELNPISIAPFAPDEPENAEIVKGIIANYEKTRAPFDPAAPENADIVKSIIDAYEEMKAAAFKPADAPPVEEAVPATAAEEAAPAAVPVPENNAS